MGRLRGMDPTTITEPPRRRRHLPAAGLVAAAGALGLLGACGGDDDAAETPTTVAAVGSDPSGATDAAISGDGDPADGEQLAQEYGCRSCHREEGGGIGPDWEGLYGSTVSLDDGSTVVADDAYLVESIVDPGAKKVAGYAIGMPVNDALTEEQIASIVAYIRSLGEAGGPDST